MLDTVTLDQLRVFITVVDEGNFSAAARKLRRVQSAISQSIGNLEIALGVTLWDRSTKIPTLTEQGRSLLGAAQRVCGEADAFRKLAQGLSMGIEASVSLCVDAFFPVPALVEVCLSITKEFPFVDLRVDTQPTSGVYARVLSGSATIGVVSPLGTPPGLESRAMAPIRMIPVVALEHPLAKHEGRVAAPHFVEHVQIVLADPRDEPPPDLSVLSSVPFASPISPQSTH
jgi:DNA-binding transcriptional LysR family regulator